jgi:putative nucleotidyltransferase-like protein
LNVRTLTEGRPAPTHGGNGWPTPAEELLLRAALDSPPKAVEAWRAWSTEERLAGIETGSQRLLPAVYRNLSAHGVADRRMGMLAGAYRRSWYRNQFLFDAAAKLIDQLAAAGLPALVIKGAALCTLHYRDIGARPMDDVDVLVAPEHARLAMAVLEQAGWRSAPTPIPRDILSARPSWHYVSTNGGSVDLHWRVFERSRSNERDLWDAALPLDLARTRTRALAPVDELLLTCTHGVMWNTISPIRWVVDAAMIVHRAERSLDWERCIGLAERHGLGYSASELLAYLQREFVPEIPVAAIERLKSTAPHRGARITHRALLASPPSARNIRLNWEAYRTRTLVPGERHLGFVEFMVQRYHLAGRRQLLWFVLRKGPTWLRLSVRRGRGTPSDA